MLIQFEKANHKYQEAIFSWLEEPHVKEFWDNSQGHKDDILKFINGRIESSSYADGRYTYWVALLEGKPYSLIMTIKEYEGEERPQIKNDHLSKTGHTYSIDYMIGDKAYFGKGLGAKTLEAFTHFFQENFDKLADTFFIDPDINNPRARHVYEKAGFQYVGDFMMEGNGVFKGHKTHFLVKKLKNEGQKYDLIASGFAVMRDSFNTEQKYVDLFTSYLQPKSDILDVGCGSGYPIASYLIEKEFNVTGLDSSKELLKIAEVKCPSMKSIYGDMRTVSVKDKYDGIIEWWALFHLPKQDHEKMIARFAGWLKKDGILEFTTGDAEYEGSSSEMLNQELNYYSLDPILYERYLKDNGFKILLRENDQDQHMVWIAKKSD